MDGCFSLLFMSCIYLLGEIDIGRKIYLCICPMHREHQQTDKAGNFKTHGTIWQVTIAKIIL